ncbi:microtubule motor activity, variant 2 [Trebouxia sp. C0010 RCD-2024]
MTRELEELGGGDARVGRAAVCVMASSSKIACQSILQTSAGGLTVQDTQSGRGSKTFPLPHLHDSQSLSILTDTLGQAPVDWLFDGFNATLFAYGHSGTGKSATLFAEGCNAEQPLFHSIIQQIFAQKLPTAYGGQTHRIGFSCWALLQHQVFDLLAPPCQEGAPNQAHCVSAAADACQCVEASSAHEALSLLHAAQCSSSCWTSDQNGQMRPVPNRAHFFVRIVLYNAVKQQMSTLHVIDLAGSQSFSDHQGGCSSLKHQEKLVINQQLLSLSKFISELSRLSTSQGSVAKQVTSARDTPLVQLVGPLLAGNARTFMLAAVSKHPEHYLDTINTLLVATQAQNIQILGKGRWPEDMHGRDSRQQVAEVQRIASRHCNQHRLASASLAQLRQQKQPAPRNVPTCAGQDSRRPPHLQQQQQQCGVGFALTAANAQCSSGLCEHAGAVDLDAVPQQPSSLQPSPNPVSADGNEQSVSSEQSGLLPGQHGGRTVAGLHGEVMGGVMCDPTELTWEGVLQAASGNGQAASDAGQGDWNQTNSRQGACDPSSWGPLPPLAEPAAECHGAAGLEPSAYTPQELAAHLDKLKQEFRQICSTLLDGDSKATCHQGTAAVAIMLTDVPLAPVLCKQQTSARQREGPIASEHLPITTKHPSSPDPQLPPPTTPSCCPPADDTSMPASPYIIPCTAADCTHVSMGTCMSPAQQQHPQQQSDHIMQQPQLQQQSWSQGSQHSSSGHAAPNAGAPHQTHDKFSDMGTQRPDGSCLLDCNSSVSLGECLGQSDVGRAASSKAEEAGRRKETCRQQETHGRLGWHGSVAGCNTTRTQDSCSSTFLDGLRPGSPSHRCSPEAAAHLLAAGQGSIATKGQEVADLQVNNEALLCMLERERQHSQRLAEALQQAEANALEVKPLHL